MSGHDVLIIGAGLSGLVAARALTAEGTDVVLLDKGVGCGGRLASRRVEDACLDHGAQFFTIRDDEFADLVARWTAEGLSLHAWTNGFARSRHIGDGPAAADAGGDGHPRYAVAGGMNQIAKHLARDLQVRDRTLVTTVERDADGWRVRAEADHWRAPRVLLTAPVPQSLALLRSGDVSLPDADAAALGRIAYAPTIALLCVLDRSLELPGGDGVQLAEGPISWLGDNVAKGTSEVPALTVHASPDWSTTYYGRPDEEVRAALLRHLGPWLGEAQVTASQVKRWRYAQPTASHDQRCLATDVEGAPLVFAGDAFGETKVEGAARSGLAAARALAS